MNSPANTNNSVNISFVSANKLLDNKKSEFAQKLEQIANVEYEKTPVPTIDLIENSCGKKINEFVFSSEDSQDVKKIKCHNYLKKQTKGLKPGLSKVIFLHNCTEDDLKICKVILDELNRTKFHSLNIPDNKFQYKFSFVKENKSEFDKIILEMKKCSHPKHSLEYNS